MLTAIPPAIVSTLTNVDRLRNADYLEVTLLDGHTCVLMHCFNGWFELATGTLEHCTNVCKVVCAATRLRGVDFNGNAI